MEDHNIILLVVLVTLLLGVATGVILLLTGNNYMDAIQNESEKVYVAGCTNAAGVETHTQEFTKEDILVCDKPNPLHEETEVNYYDNLNIKDEIKLY